MSLLDDLDALDLSAAIQGKLDILAVLEGRSDIAEGGTALREILEDGAAITVLGDLGDILAAARSGFGDPAALVTPITDALTVLLDAIDIDDLPLAEYVESVTSGARVVAGLVEALSGDPRDLHVGGASLGDLFDGAGAPMAEHARTVSSGMSRFRALVEKVERGLPTDAGSLLGPALEILLPFSTDGIDGVRAWAGRVSARLDAVRVDPRLASGLVSAFGEVRLAADADDVVRVHAALESLTEVRLSTTAQLADALRRVAGTLSGLGVDEGLGPVRELRSLLAGADDTAVDLLAGWRTTLVEFRGMVEDIDPAIGLGMLTELLDLAETRATDVLLGATDEAVAAVKQAVRDLFRELPLRTLRRQFSEAIANVAPAIDEADLAAPVASLRKQITQLSDGITKVEAAPLVAKAVGEMEVVLSDAMDTVEEGLSALSTGIKNAADQAAEVLGGAVTGLREFRGLVDEVTEAIQQVGIMEAAEEIAASLRDLSDQVCGLLAEAPLPEPLRETVYQLVSSIEGIDVDEAVGRPLREVAARLAIPDDVATTVRSGLQAVADATTALVPAKVIAELEKAMERFQVEMEELDPDRLAKGISELLTEAAGTFEGVDFAALLGPATAVHDEVLGAVDRLHPRKLLAPAIRAHTEILGRTPLPDPETMTARAGKVFSSAGEAVARMAAEPIRQAVDPQATVPAAGTGTSSAPEDPPEDLRIGDVVRLVGFLPAKLHEALAVLDVDAAVEVMGSIDDLLHGTATAVRTVRDRLVDIDNQLLSVLDDVLAPVTAAQVDAQLALEGSAVLSTDGFDATASFSALIDAGPAGLELALGGETRLVLERGVTARSALVGSAAAALDDAADLLDALVPDELTSDVNAFLAALDPEPIAAEMDAVLSVVVALMPDVLTNAGEGIQALGERVRRLIEQFNPGALALRFLAVLDVVREELDVLDPGRLADELGEVHAQIRTVIQAWDPRALAADLNGLLSDAADALSTMDVAAMLPDLSGIGVQTARITELLPAAALAGVGEQLEDVGAELGALDITEMIETVNLLGPEVTDTVPLLVLTIRDEIKALLDSIRYRAGSAPNSSEGST